MKLNDPIDIMRNFIFPDKNRIMSAVRELPPGETLRLKIENSFVVKNMVDRLLKNQWCRVVDTEDEGNLSIITIKKET